MTKPHLCACGETNPRAFYPKTKSKCKKCTSAAALARLEADPTKKYLNAARSAQWQNDNVLRYRWNSARARALRTGLEFSITMDDIEELWTAQSGKCMYSGAEMTLCKDAGVASVSIDRVDSTKGYTTDNVVLCTSICNQMKNDMNMEIFKQWVAAIHNHLHRL